MNVVAVDHIQITIPKGSEDEARAFYCGILGLIEVAKPEALEGRGGFWLTLSGLQVHVGTENETDRTTTKAHIGYRVDRLEEWQKKLTQIGVETVTGIQIPGFKRFEFRDPFGNRVEFLEPQT